MIVMNWVYVRVMREESSPQLASWSGGLTSVTLSQVCVSIPLVPGQAACVSCALSQGTAAYCAVLTCSLRTLEINTLVVLLARLSGEFDSHVDE